MMGIFNPFKNLIKSIVDEEFNKREQEAIDSASKEIEQYLIMKDEGTDELQ
jgi:hypothetical protein